MKSHDSAHLEKYTQLLANLGLTNDPLAAEMVQTVLKLNGDDPGRAEMKLILRSLKELRYAFKIFKPYRNRRKISIFGSARTPPNHPNYLLAKHFAHLAANSGFMVITGAGGGIMAAGHEGAGLAHSFGVAIKLPFEQATNPVIAKDEKLIHFRYFFSRKLVFVKETHAIALFPGGFGTHDEGFEVLTLVQTGRCDPLPIVMLEAKGGGYWKAWDKFVRAQLLAEGLINEEDLSLYFITQDPQAALDHIARFYRNYHSLRYVRDELVLRIKHAPTPEELEAIRTGFSDIVVRGTFEVRSASKADHDTEIVPEMPRLVFEFDRRSLGRLRMLIDHLNTLPSLPVLEPPPRPAEVGSTTVSDREIGEIAEEEPIKLVEPAVKGKTATPATPPAGAELQKPKGRVRGSGGES